MSFIGTQLTPPFFFDLLCRLLVAGAVAADSVSVLSAAAAAAGAAGDGGRTSGTGEASRAGAADGTVETFSLEGLSFLAGDEGEVLTSPRLGQA
jgi:hypothetical protein